MQAPSKLQDDDGSTRVEGSSTNTTPRMPLTPVNHERIVDKVDHDTLVGMKLLQGVGNPYWETTSRSYSFCIHSEQLESNHMVETSLIWSGKDKIVPYIGLFPKVVRHEATWIRADGVLYDAGKGQVRIFGRTLPITVVKEGDTYGIGYDAYMIVGYKNGFRVFEEWLDDNERSLIAQPMYPCLGGRGYYITSALTTNHMKFRTVPEGGADLLTGSIRGMSKVHVSGFFRTCKPYVELRLGSQQTYFRTSFGVKEETGDDAYNFAVKDFHFDVPRTDIIAFQNAFLNVRIRDSTIGSDTVLGWACIGPMRKVFKLDVPVRVSLKCHNLGVVECELQLGCFDRAYQGREEVVLGDPTKEPRLEEGAAGTATDGNTKAKANADINSFGGSSDGEDDDDADGTNETQRKEEEEIRKIMLERSRATILYPGEYVVRVHVIQLKDLAPKDWQGTSDPVVQVTCFGEKKTSRIFPPCNGCVVDELFVFEKELKKKNDLPLQSLDIRVMDADAKGLRKQLIGTFNATLDQIYYRDHNEMYRAWVALVDQENPEEIGIRGYCMLSIMVLGPRDTPRLHSEPSILADECTDVALPPNIQLQRKTLYVRVFSAIGIPYVNKSLLGEQSVQAYVQVDFGKYCTYTTTQDLRDTQINKTVEWNDELLMPVVLPTLVSTIKISLWDRERVVANKMLASQSFDLHEIIRNPISPRWMNFYNGPKFCGRVLLQLFTRDSDDKCVRKPVRRAMGQDLMVRRLRHDNAGADNTHFRVQIMVALVDYGTVDESITIRICHGLETQKRKVSTDKTGVCVVADNFVFRKTLPDDLDQAPHVIVSIDDSFFVMTLRDMPQSESPTFHWYPLTPESSADGGEHSPMILCAMQLQKGTSGTESPLWGPELANLRERMASRVPWTVSLKLYQALHMMAMDPDGLSDPFVTVTYNGRKLKTKVQNNTLNPVFMETLSWPNVMLPVSQKGGPLDLSLCPGIRITVWDRDITLKSIQQKDFLGTCYFPISGAIIHDMPDKVHPPRWLRLRCAKQGVCEGNSLFEPPKALSVGGEMVRFAPDKSEQITSIKVGDKNAPFVRKPDGSMSFITPQLQEGAWDVMVFRQLGDGRKKSEYGKRVCLADDAGNPLSTWDAYGQLLFEDAPAILAAVELNVCNEPQAPLISQSTLMWVDFFVIGLRGLCSGSLPLNAPFISFNCCSCPLPSRTLESKTTQSLAPTSLPSPRNPNFLQKLRFPLAVPLRRKGDLPFFYPIVNIEVKDSHFANLWTNDIGATSLHLHEMMYHSDAGYVRHALPKSYLETVRKEMQTQSSADKAKEEWAGRSSKLMHFQTSFGYTLRAEEEKREGKSPMISRPVVDETARLLEEEDHEDEEHAEYRLLDHPENDAQSDDDNLEEPDWKKGRMVLDHSLDKDLPPVFDTYEIFRGRGKSRRTVGLVKGLVQVVDDGCSKRCHPNLTPEIYSELFSPKTFVCRVYILDAINIPDDDDEFGKSDPFVTVQLGDTIISDKDFVQWNSDHCEVYKCFEIPTTLPGSSQVIITLMDADYVSTSDIIGYTVIDLEDRWFNSTWQKCYRRRPPIERHTLYTDTSTSSRGEMRLFCEILSTEEASQLPPLDITPAPPIGFEVRLVLWKTEDVPAGDAFEESDLWLRASMPGTEAQETDVHWRAYQGVGSFNWRTIFGVQLPVAPEYARVQLQAFDADPLSPWKPRDLLGEADLDVSKELRQAYVQEMKRRRAMHREVRLHTEEALRIFTKCLGNPDMESAEPLRLLEDYQINAEDLIPKGSELIKMVRQKAPAVAVVKLVDDVLAKKKDAERKRPAPEEVLRNRLRTVPLVKHFLKEDSLETRVKNKEAFWVNFHKLQGNLTKERAGRVAVSLEIVPSMLADIDPVGIARKEPNKNPFLPKPEGRMKISKWINPYNMFFDLCGPKCARASCGAFVCISFVFIVLTIGCFVLSIEVMIPGL
eukprot:GEMP01000503.1.p1 GENE.GEMP01000503.1~~GEMP01000503.1.p1  ORF type:complete len:1954 (+),score=493.38 GEMP01000503.1:276-6137(+)